MAEHQVQEQITSRSWKVIPFFRSSNILNTVAFYKDTLSMKSGPLYPSESDARFVSLSCGPKAAVNIYFQIYDSATAEERPRGRAMVALEKPEDVVSLHEHLIESGLHRQGEKDHDTQKFGRRCDVTDVEDAPWGYRQFSMWDIDLNELQFFSFINSDE